MATPRSDFVFPRRMAHDARSRGGRFEPTPEERAARERLNADPGRWRPPHGSLEVARYELDIDVAPEHAEALRKATADVRFYSVAGGTSSLRVLHGAGWSRVELVRNVLGEGSTIVRSPDRRVLFLDPGKRLFLHLAPEQLPTWRERVPQRVRVRDDTPGAPQRAGRRFVIEADASRAEIELEADPRLAPFAVDAFTVILGVDAQLFPDVVRLQREGFPVAGATWLASDANAVPALRWRVSNARVERVEASLFDVPAEWLDLRDTETVAFHAPQGGYTMDAEREFRPRYETKLEKSWFQVYGTLNPVPVDPADSSMQDLIGRCIDSRYGNAVGIHVTQTALDDVRTLVNLVLKRVQFFQGDNGIIRVDWLRQFREYADSLPEGDGVYSLLCWPPDPAAPWPPAPGTPPTSRRPSVKTDLAASR